MSEEKQFTVTLSKSELELLCALLLEREEDQLGAASGREDETTPTGYEKPSVQRKRAATARALVDRLAMASGQEQASGNN